MANDNKGARQTTIDFEINLDEQNIPVSIYWNATDAPADANKEARAILLALWDAKANNGLSIDLWTKEMTVQEMNLFYFQTMMSMSESFMRSTQQKDLADEIQKFAKEWIEKVKQKEKQEVSK